MKLGQIGLYVLAGYGAYAMYERFLAGGGTAPAPIDATSSFTGTNWQRGGPKTTRPTCYSSCPLSPCLLDPSGCLAGTGSPKLAPLVIKRSGW